MNSTEQKVEDKLREFKNFIIEEFKKLRAKLEGMSPAERAEADLAGHVNDVQAAVVAKHAELTAGDAPVRATPPPKPASHAAGPDKA